MDPLLPVPCTILPSPDTAGASGFYGPEGVNVQDPELEIVPLQQSRSESQHHAWTGNFSVSCEEIEEEDDIIAIRGIRWRENDQTSFLLEQIEDLPVMSSHDIIDSISADDEEWLPPINIDDVDAGSEIDDENEDEDIGASADKATRDYSFEHRKPPSITDASAALHDLRLLLKPPRL
jgi:hypothetical protein